ncbi:hypothetical protein NMG60_11006266 [Bertholletia excelsa]
MRPTPEEGNVWRLNTPIPYLFGGLALMMVLITLALVILACSFRKQVSNSSNAGDGDEEKPEKPKIADAVNLEPKILVIMAGDDRPTYLATPTTQSTGIPTASAESSDGTSANVDETKIA